MRYVLLFSWLWLLPLGAVRAGGPVGALTDTLHLNYDDSGLFGRYFAYCFDPDAQPSTGARALALWQAGRFRPLPRANGVLQGGYSQDRLWLRAVVVNTLPQRTRFVWSLYQFVDSATLFRQPEGRGPLRLVAGGSSRVVAAQRPFPARAVCLPIWLEAHARAVLYLRVENYAGAWCLPTDMSTTEGFLSYEQTYFAFKNWAWLLGFYVGSALFNLILFTFLRDRIYLWYGAYVFCMTWFLLMEDSLDAQLLPPAAYALGWQLGQSGLLLLALACELRILAAFVRLRAGWPRLHRLSWWLSGAAAGYALAYPLLFGAARQQGATALAWLNGGRVVLLWTLLLAGALLLGVAAGWGRPPHRRLAALYACTYVFLLLGTVETLLNYAGVFYLHLVEPNSLAWGLALELALLSVLLTARFRQAQRQNAALRLRHLRERALAGQLLIGAQDEEREALARELHDALAPGLTALHLAWQGRQVREALAHGPPALAEAHKYSAALLRQLRYDVRTLSHVLLPPAPGAPLPLPEAVTLLAETMSLTDEGPLITSQCDAAAAALPLPLQQAAYRIVAELLHNALRHAQARRVRVAVRRLPATLRLTVEDDGRGFDPRAPLPPRGGLGLRGVQARTGYLRGQVQVRSQPGQGTSITVELPV